MADIEPKWVRGAGAQAYDGRVKIVEYAATLPNGLTTTYEVDESIPFAVAVLICTHDDLVVVTRQYRFPLDNWIYDLPGGAGNPGESIREAARRECREEIGVDPSDLVLLHTFYSNPGRSCWPTHVFLCRASRDAVVDASDPSEVVNKLAISLHELDSLILNGEVVDPALLIGRAAGAWHGHLPSFEAVDHNEAFNNSHRGRAAL